MVRIIITYAKSALHNKSHNCVLYASARITTKTPYVLQNKGVVGTLCFFPHKKIPCRARARARTTTHGGVNDNDDDDATLWSLPYVCLTRVMTENVNENRLARRTGICRANAFRGGRCRLLRCARDVILCTYRVLLLY